MTKYECGEARERERVCISWLAATDAGGVELDSRTTKDSVVLVVEQH